MNTIHKTVMYVYTAVSGDVVHIHTQYDILYLLLLFDKFVVTKYVSAFVYSKNLIYNLVLRLN